MKHWKLIVAFATVFTGTTMPAHAEVDLSANIGIMSDYIYRGFHQSDAAANGGIDLATGPFYLGVWAADLDSDNGMEIDVYGGLAWEFENGFSAYVGYTAYRYTEDDDGEVVVTDVTEDVVDSNTGAVRRLGVYEDAKGNRYGLTEDEASTGGTITTSNVEVLSLADMNDPAPDTLEFTDLKKIKTEACTNGGFDQDYDEINLGVSYAEDDFSVSLDYAIGEHENGHTCGGEDNDYDIATLTLDYKGAYVTFGTYGISEDDVANGEPEGDYFELGYATTINDLDFAVYLVDSDEDIDDETRLGLSISYGFDL